MLETKNFLGSNRQNSREAREPIPVPHGRLPLRRRRDPPPRKRPQPIRISAPPTEVSTLSVRNWQSQARFPVRIRWPPTRRGDNKSERRVGRPWKINRYVKPCPVLLLQGGVG